MGRALSWSLAAHLAFIVTFLLLSATRQPLTIPQVARPVRLVTYLEPAPAARPRAVPVVTPEAPRPAPSASVPPARMPPAVAAAPTPSTAALSAAAARVAIPVREREPAAARPPTPQAEPRPALSERLARRLASAAPAESRSAEIAPPQIASLPPAEPAAVAPAAAPDRPAAAAPSGAPQAVTPVGYFPHAWYLAVLKERIFARWVPPSEYFQSRRPPIAVVSFRIDHAGGIGNVTLKEGSGSARFDKSALAAILGLGTVAPLPEQYREESLDVVIRFQNAK